MTYNITINDDELKALQNLWWLSTEECIRHPNCDTCRFFDTDNGKCTSNEAYHVIRRCIEWSVKFARKESDENA